VCPYNNVLKYCLACRFHRQAPQRAPFWPAAAGNGRPQAAEQIENHSHIKKNWRFFFRKNKEKTLKKTKKKTLARTPCFVAPPGSALFFFKTERSLFDKLCDYCLIFQRFFSQKIALSFLKNCVFFQEVASFLLLFHAN